ncbi:MAG: hypothetical protein ACM3PV_00180 [Betaproteobacteria bacterium]
MTTRRRLPQSLSASAALASVVPRDGAVPAERFVAPLNPFGLTALTAS